MDETTNDRADLGRDAEEAAAEAGGLVPEALLDAPDTGNAGDYCSSAGGCAGVPDEWLEWPAGGLHLHCERVVGSGGADGRTCGRTDG